MKIEFKESELKCFIEGRQVEGYLNGENFASMGEVHPAVLNKFGIEMPVALFELDLGMVYKRVIL